MSIELPPINMDDFAKWKSGSAVIQVDLLLSLNSDYRKLIWMIS